MEFLTKAIFLQFIFVLNNFGSFFLVILLPKLNKIFLKDTWIPGSLFLSYFLDFETHLSLKIKFAIIKVKFFATAIHYREESFLWNVTFNLALVLCILGKLMILNPDFFGKSWTPESTV